MSQQFWKLVTSTLKYEIPDVIRNSISLSGYDDALAFKDLNDDDIAKIEKYMREEALESVASTLSESFDEKCDALLDNDQLTKIFGERYATQPENFKFLPGQVSLIRILASHVKQLVEVGGLQQFNEKKKKRKNKNFDRVLSCVQKQEHASEETTIVQPCHRQLKSDLFEKVIICLKSYGVDVSNFTDSCVEVEPNGAYGKITCILCQDENEKPKRVFYHSKTNFRSSYWVISNFNKHLEKKHSLVSVRSKETQSKKQKQHIESSGKLQPIAQSLYTHSSVEHPSIQTTSTENENEMDEIEANQASSDEVKPIDNSDGESNNNPMEVSDFSIEIVSVTVPIDANSLFVQMSEQIQQMVAATLVNGDKQYTMQFNLKVEVQTLTIVKTEPNGDCLFSSIAHQLWQNEITSQQHQRMTKNLRKTVVEHILKPANFNLYEHILEDRITGDQDKKLFVRLILARSGQWGGLETIKAVSNEYNVNVIIVKESGKCNMIQGTNDKQYNRTIMIAYRLATNADGQYTYNHYDSVTDMSTNCIFKAAEFITNEQT